MSIIFLRIQSFQVPSYLNLQSKIINMLVKVSMSVKSHIVFIPECMVLKWTLYKQAVSKLFFTLEVIAIIILIILKHNI